MEAAWYPHSGVDPAPIPHMGILHPHWSFLLYFLNAREAVKPLMFPGVLLQCLYLHTPTSAQPTHRAPHLQTAWCVLPKGQRCISTHPPVPDGPLGGLTLAMRSQLPPSTLTHVTSAFLPCFQPNSPFSLAMLTVRLISSYPQAWEAETPRQVTHLVNCVMLYLWGNSIPAPAGILITP